MLIAAVAVKTMTAVKYSPSPSAEPPAMEVIRDGMRAMVEMRRNSDSLSWVRPAM